MSVAPRYRKIDHILLGVIRLTTAILLMIMSIVIIKEVIFRYALNAPVFWTEELARYVMFYMVLIGSVVAIRQQRHPALTFVIQKFPVRFRRIWNLLIDALVFLVLIVVLKQGALMAVRELIGKTPALRISFFWVYLALPIGAFLMMVQIIAKHVFGKAGFDKNNNAPSSKED